MGFCVSDPQASVSVYWVSQRPEEGQILQKLRDLCPVSRGKRNLKIIRKKERRFFWAADYRKQKKKQRETQKREENGPRSYVQSFATQ